MAINFPWKYYKRLNGEIETNGQKIATLLWDGFNTLANKQFENVKLNKRSWNAHVLVFVKGVCSMLTENAVWRFVLQSSPLFESMFALAQHKLAHYQDLKTDFGESERKSRKKRRLSIAINSAEKRGKCHTLVFMSALAMNPTSGEGVPILDFNYGLRLAYKLMRRSNLGRAILAVIAKSMMKYWSFTCHLPQCNSIWFNVTFHAFQLIQCCSNATNRSTQNE